MSEKLALVKDCSPEQLMVNCMKVLNGEASLFCIPHSFQKLYALPHEDLEDICSSIQKFELFTTVSFNSDGYVSNYGPLYGDKITQWLTSCDLCLEPGMYELSATGAREYAGTMISGRCFIDLWDGWGSEPGG